MNTNNAAQQAGEVVESIVGSYLKTLGRRSGRKRGLLSRLFGLLVVAGGAAGVYYAQADEQQRQEAGAKVKALAEQVLDQVEGLKS